MKQKLYEGVLILFILLISCMCSIPYKTKLKEYQTDDITSQVIRNNIYSYANILMKKSDLNLKNKKIMNGLLPDSYPKVMIERARRLREKKNDWKSI